MSRAIGDPSTQIHRLPERGVDDVAVLYEILDEALVAHVGFVRDGMPVVIPTLHARVDDELVLHGSPSAGFIRAARGGATLCVTVTLLDGLVLARSAFHHSVNYRSAVVFGRPRRLEGDEKTPALDAFVDRLIPGRRPLLRDTTKLEVQKTEVLALPLDTWSAKTRSGMPHDEEEDYRLSIWAGVVPLATVAGDPESDLLNLPEVTLPDHVADWGAARLRREGL
ncbi:MAG: pyridoxamine 5'-phosphate oxidase family protein [Acidimicrobiia bacterium]